MPVFPLRTSYQVESNTNALGTSARIEVTREFHIDAIYIRLDFVVATAMATAAADGLFGILKRARITCADGVEPRTVVDCSGRGLVEYSRQVVGGAPASYYDNVKRNATGTYTLFYPVYFAHPQLDSPLCDAFLLPAPRFNQNITVQLDFSSQAEMDVNGTPTFALTGAITTSLVIHRRDVRDPNFLTYNTELIETIKTFPSAAAKQTHFLDVPGSYTGILFRCYSSTSAFGDITYNSGEFSIQWLANVMRQFRLGDTDAINAYSKFFPYATPTTQYTFGADVTGHYFQDFITDGSGRISGELGSVLDTNLMAATGAQLKLLCDVNGGSNVQIKFVHHRVFGDLRKLKLAA